MASDRTTSRMPLRGTPFALATAVFVATKPLPSATCSFRAAGLALSLSLACGTAVAAKPLVPDDDWPTAARDGANTRYAPLGDIDVRNVAGLKEVFRFATGVQRGHEAAPIIAGGMMFVVTPFPNVVYGLSLVPG